MNKFLNTFILLISALLLGLLTGALSAGFLQLIDLGQTFLWKNAWADFSLYPLLICTLGGLLVGLCQKYLGDHPKDLQQSMLEIKNNGRMEYKFLPHGILAAAVSLIFGASLGPEAAIMGLLGGLSTWASDMLAKVRSKLGLSNIPMVGSRIKFILHHWPTGLAIGLGIFSFGFGVKELYSGGFLKMSESFVWQDVIWSIPLGILGTLVGYLFTVLLKQSKRMLIPLKEKPIIKATLAGIFLGISASLFPMMLFSGQHEIQNVYENAAQLGAVLLFTIALLRLVNIGLLLNSGWKGGQFLPLMFASTAIGLACSVMVPGISAPTGILASMSGLLVMVLPTPWIVLAIMLMMFPLEYIGVMFTATLSAVLIRKGIENKQALAAKTNIRIVETE